MEIKNIVMGGLYKNKHSQWNNEQSYGMSVPILGEDAIWMVDTKILSGSPFGHKTSKAIDIICNKFSKENNQYVINEAVFRHYYQNAMKIVSEDQLERDFELICDLHDYRPLDKYESSRDYESENIIYGVKLYEDHGYSMNLGSIGVTLVRKDAEKSLERIFEKNLSDCWNYFTFPANITKLDLERVLKAKESCEENNIQLDPRSLRKLEQIEYLKTRIKYMKQEILDYIEDTKYVHEYTYTKGCALFLKDIPTINEYLKNNCYWENEIYQKFYAETPIKVIAKGDLGLAVIAKSDEDLYPQIIYFEYDKDKITIIDSIRFDITDNNINTAKKIVNEKIDFKVDENTKSIRDAELDEIINSLEEVSL